MIKRVFNEELNRFVYRIKKSDFIKELDSKVAERAWNDLVDKFITSVDFEEYRLASHFAGMLANKYSVFLIEA